MDNVMIALVVSVDIWAAAFWWVACDIRSYLKDIRSALEKREQT